MKISQITVKYEETASLPNYSNIRPSISFTVDLEPEDNPDEVQIALLARARGEVRREIDHALDLNGCEPKYDPTPRFVVFAEDNHYLTTIWPSKDGYPDRTVGGDWRGLPSRAMLREDAVDLAIKTAARYRLESGNEWSYLAPEDPALPQELIGKPEEDAYPDGEEEYDTEEEDE